MERTEYISSVIYEGLLYGSGLAIAPFLLEDLSSAPQSSHYGYMVSMATLGGCYHLGVFVGKFFSHGFKNCLGYYNTHFVDFFCLLALVVFGFSANITWLFIGRIVVGFMAGIQGKVSSVSALLYTDYASYELSVAVSTLVFSCLYWSSVDNLIPNSENDIPASEYFTDHPASLGTVAFVVLMFLVYVLYFIRKQCMNNDKSAYMPITEGTEAELDRLVSTSRPIDAGSIADSSIMSFVSDSDGIDRSELYNKVPSRYVRGCKGDTVEARRRWHLTLDWRQEDDVDNILRERQPNFFKIKECYPHYFHNRSKDGHPVYYERIGYVDRKKMKSYGITVSMLVRHYVFITEYLWNQLETDDENGASVSIMDVENVGLRDLMGETMEFLSISSKIIQGHYVERCHKIFVVNAPFFFNALWKAVSPMVHENTKKKISILGSNRTELLECIDSSQLPVAYGGTGSPLGTSKEEADLAEFVKLIGTAEQKAPFSSGENAHAESATSSISRSVIPGADLTRTSPHREMNAKESSFTTTATENGGFIDLFKSTVSSVVSSIKENTFNVMSSSDSGHAYLGTKNEYVYDENSNAWVLYSPDPVANVPDDSPTFDPREARGGHGVSRDNSANSVVTPLLTSPRKSATKKKEFRPNGLSSGTISALLSKHRQETGPQAWEFTALCVVLLLFHAVLVYVLEMIPVWLYLPHEYGGWNYSVANVGLVMSLSSLVAAFGLYIAGYPKHIVYTPVCTRYSTEEGTEVATVELHGQDRIRESRALSTSPFPTTPSRRGTSGNHLNQTGKVSHVPLQALFWLAMLSQFLSLLLILVLLPLFFRDVAAWPNLKNLCFHISLCLVVSSTIFSLAAVYECIIVTKKASVLSSSQDMMLTFCISFSSMAGAFFGPFVLYLSNVRNGKSAGMVGAQALVYAEIAVFLLLICCYIKPPKYPLYFYS